MSDLPHATLASGSCLRCASNTASLIWSQILSVDQHMLLSEHTQTNQAIAFPFKLLSGKKISYSVEKLWDVV